MEIIDYTEKLRSLKKFEIASQLCKTRTSNGANTWEAQNGKSIADFIHKFKIAAKEADETSYWLELCKVLSTIPTPKQTLYQN